MNQLQDSILSDDEERKIAHIKDKNLLFQIASKAWQRFSSKFVQTSAITPFQKNFHIYENLAYQSNKVYCLLDLSNFEFLDITENIVDFCGYSKEEFMNGNTRLFFSLFDIKQIKVFWQVPKWFYFLDKYIHRLSSDACYTTSFCGFKIKTKNKGTIQCLSRHFQPSDGYQQSVLIAEITDVTHLLKSDKYWFRAHVDKDNSIFTFMSDKRKIVKKDFLTQREKEILACLAKEMSNQEIAEALFISPQTLSTHRKNMIRKLGVKDSISMIEICKSVGMI